MTFLAKLNAGVPLPRSAQGAHTQRPRPAESQQTQTPGPWTSLVAVGR